MLSKFPIEIFFIILHYVSDDDLLNILRLSKSINHELIDNEIFWNERAQRRYYLDINFMLSGFKDDYYYNRQKKYFILKIRMKYFIIHSVLNISSSSDKYHSAYIKDMVEILSQQKDLSEFLISSTDFLQLWYKFIIGIIKLGYITGYQSKTLLAIPLPLHRFANRDELDLIIKRLFGYLDGKENNVDPNIELFINSLVCIHTEELVGLIFRLLTYYNSYEGSYIELLHRCCLYRVAQLSSDENTVKKIMSSSTVSYELFLCMPNLLEMLSMGKQQFIIDEILKEYYIGLIDYGILFLTLIIPSLAVTVNINILGSLTLLHIEENEHIPELKKNIVKYLIKFPDAMTSENLGKILEL